MLKGLGGLEVTPAGRPVKVTCTEPVKPFRGLTESVTALLLMPCVTETDVAERLRTKSGEEGGGVCTIVLNEPPPQEAHHSGNVSQAAVHRRNRPMTAPLSTFPC
jgi:hypothetical protein